jgi:hypothetical protein
MNGASMANLYWKHQNKVSELETKPFPTEADFEKYLFENQNLLGDDLFIIKRQVRTGTKEDILDMIGVDRDSRICIIELKNVEATEDIVPQALRYAIWAETNPDSIKNLWLECKNKPDDINIDWDNLEIRILLVAPAFRQNVLKISKKINYKTELYKVLRYSDSDNEFVSVEILEEDEKKIVSTHAKEEWDWKYYEANHDKDSVENFRKAVHQIDDLCKKQKWNVPFNLNKAYVGFKKGKHVLFDVGWVSISTWCVHIKVPEKTAKEFPCKNWRYHNYEKSFNNAVFRPNDPSNLNIDELKGLFEIAYKRK